MPVPYTIEAVKALFHAESTRTPSAEIQQLLGWDGAMLARVCRKHGVGLIGAVADVPYVPPPPPRFAVRDPLRTFAGAMNGYAGILLTRLVRRHLGEVVTSTELEIESSNCSAAKTRANKLLKAAGLPWMIERVSRNREHEHGYRLVRTDGGDARA